MVCQQEVRLRNHYIQGRHKGRGKVQEQRPDNLPEEEASVPHEIRQVPGAD